MFAKLKSAVFIDGLRLEVLAPKGNCIRGILRDEKGTVCRTMEKDVADEKEELSWNGLNDLPYGRYTLELMHGADEMRVNLVKRV
ncbi:MAG: hypothetical protein RIR12_2417 [Bacteroidota bacterium]|jgi:hypothetical protein